MIPPLHTVTVLGVTGSPSKATLNGATISDVSFDSNKHILTMTGFNTGLGSALSIKWM